MNGIPYSFSNIWEEFNVKTCLLGIRKLFVKKRGNEILNTEESRYNEYNINEFIKLTSWAGNALKKPIIL